MELIEGRFNCDEHERVIECEFNFQVGPSQTLSNDFLTQTHSCSHVRDEQMNEWKQLRSRPPTKDGTSAYPTRGKKHTVNSIMASTNTADESLARHIFWISTGCSARGVAYQMPGNQGSSQSSHRNFINQPPHLLSQGLIGPNEEIFVVARGAASACST